MVGETGAEKVIGGGGFNQAVRDLELEVGAPSLGATIVLLSGMGLPSLAAVRLAGSTTARNKSTNARNKNEHILYLLVPLSATLRGLLGYGT